MFRVQPQKKTRRPARHRLPAACLAFAAPALLAPMAARAQDTIGSAAIGRAFTDGSNGVTAIYAGGSLLPGAQVTTLTFFLNASGARSLTPLLFEETTPEVFTLRGIGTARTVNPSASAQSFEFGLTGGTDTAANGNYTFGIIFAVVGANGGSRAVHREASSSTPRRPGRESPPAARTSGSSPSACRRPPSRSGAASGGPIRGRRSTSTPRTAPASSPTAPIPPTWPRCPVPPPRSRSRARSASSPPRPPPPCCSGGAGLPCRGGDRGTRGPPLYPVYLVHGV